MNRQAAQPDSGRHSYTMAEERAMLSSLMNGNRQAAEGLIDRTYRSIYGFLFRLCGEDESLAADLTQETYQKAWRSLGEFDGRSRFSTWLYRIAHNTFLNHMRRPQRVESIEDRTFPPPAALDPGFEQQMMDEEMKERTRRAVLALPDDLRFTIAAYYWGGLSVRDLARSEGISTVAVRKRMKRALKSIAYFFEEKYP